MRIAKAKQFEKQYKKLPLEIQKQFAEQLTLFLNNKNHSQLHVHSLKGKYTGLLSFSVAADIRVIFDDSSDGMLILVAIDSHSELYG